MVLDEVAERYECTYRWHGLESVWGEIGGEDLFDAVEVGRTVLVVPRIHLPGQQVVGRVLCSSVFRSFVIMLQEDALRANGDVPSVSDAFVDVLLLDAERALPNTAVDVPAEEREVG